MENLLKRIKEVSRLTEEIGKVVLSKEEMILVDSDYEVGELAIALLPNEVEVIELESNPDYDGGAKVALVRLRNRPEMAFVVFSKKNYTSNYYQLHLIIPGFRSRGYAIAFEPVPGIDSVCHEKGIKSLYVENYYRDWKRNFPSLDIHDVGAGQKGKYFEIS